MSAAVLLRTTVLLVAVLGCSRPALPQTLPLEIELSLDPHTRQMEARAAVRPPAGEFVFVLHESLTVAAATIDGKPASLGASAPQQGLRAWRTMVPAGATLQLEYGGQLPALAARLDHRQVLRRLPPMASRAGSYLPAGSGWYPAPAARFAYRVALSLPADQRALVPGSLLDERLPVDEGGRYRARFEFADPADGIDLMAGPWAVRERMVHRNGQAPLRLRTYFPAELDAEPGLADAYLDDSRRYIERYAARIGAYPFDAFSVVASPLPTGFGMPTLTYIGADVLRLPFIRATSLGHEILHNWWGNGVQVDYASGNWSEGLTTFMADYAFKEDASAEAAREMRLGWLRDFAAVPEGREHTLTQFRARTHGAAAAIGYGKAAMLFVMLRDLIGEQAFERGIRIFWMEQRFRVAGWTELRRAFELASGRSLAVFFAQWLERAGAPDPAIVDARASTESGRTRLTLALAQPAPPYALRLPIELLTDSGSEMHWVALEGKAASLTLALDEVPRGVRLDPELRVWRMLEPGQLPPILRQWILARTPRLTIASGDAAVVQAVEALAARLFENPVRRAAADALTEPHGPVLLAGLHDDIDATLAASGLPPRPAAIGRRGSAQAWTIALEGKPPVAVVSARDAEALRSLQRPLPHYGAQSWLVFEDGRALERGTWPAPGRVIPVLAAE